ncbi:MAG: hypothetical protein ACJA16_004816 [Akkermansiaceae bacterium]|jgi:hypothetical protein
MFFTTSLSVFFAFAEETKTDTDIKPNDAVFWKSVYEENHVVNINISLTKEAWKSMQPQTNDRERGGPRGGGRPEGPPPGTTPRGERGREDQGSRGGPPPGGSSESKFEYVKADITVDGELFKDAGLRFKGNSSYRFSSNGFKRPLKIDTNRFVADQKLHGRTKLNLSNSYLDPAFMKEKLAYEIYQAAGMPTPGTGWAKVVLSIEGEFEEKTLGIYVLIEQVDPHYLVRQLGERSKDSLLMKPEGTTDWQNPGEDAESYERAFDIKAGEDNEDQIHQFGDFLNFIKDAPDPEFARKIGDKMDLDLLAGYLASTSLLASLDSYVAAPHNYYLLMDKADGKTRLLPWDVNEAFGTFTLGTSPESLVDWDIDRPWISNIPLLERLFATKEFPKLFQKKLILLMKTPFTEKHLSSRIETFTKALKPHLNQQERADLHLGINGDDSGFNTGVSRSVLAIKPFIKERIKSVKAQLAGTNEGQKIESRRGPGRSRPQEQGPSPTRSTQPSEK